MPVHSEVMCCELSDGREGLAKEKRDGKCWTEAHGGGWSLLLI